MSRPPQWDRASDDEDRLEESTPVRVALKRMSSEGRAYVLAWLCTHYKDNGGRFDGASRERRRRVTIDGVDYWLVRVAKPG
jgi:hypothetical protein